MHDTLKTWRKDAGFNQEELAEKLGWDRTTVTRYETANLIPSAERILLFGKACDRSDDEIAAVVMLRLELVA